MALFGALILAYGVGLVAKNRDLEATTLPISMAWMYLPLLPAGAVTLMQGHPRARRGAAGAAANDVGSAAPPT
jgi:TRAP-type C4-dicarboxylate transport system permease small subunit